MVQDEIGGNLMKSVKSSKHMSFIVKPVEKPKTWFLEYHFI